MLGHLGWVADDRLRSSWAWLGVAARGWAWLRAHRGSLKAQLGALAHCLAVTIADLQRAARGHPPDKTTAQIAELFCAFKAYRVSHVFRAANRAADFIASFSCLDDVEGIGRNRRVVEEIASSCEGDHRRLGEDKERGRPYKCPESSGGNRGVTLPELRRPDTEHGDRKLRRSAARERQGDS
ncbi:hypothetical protein AXF42_Ash000257 [Apostasia shenzhenica]|uniref:RNase H type-1 domain-containing protein n=1 Tax=Apostasia shenzhenica TaxID=1088818 RepID=A0A2I0AFU3_9ASPA|nr:hypothetical protein AXF42_Ash000257 [Apostasia shenzhenica]